VLCTQDAVLFYRVARGKQLGSRRRLHHGGPQLAAVWTMAQDAGLPHANKGLTVEPREDGSTLGHEVLLPERLQPWPARLY